jgi:hypothetical protein
MKLVIIKTQNICQKDTTSKKVKIVKVQNGVASYQKISNNRASMSKYRSLRHHFTYYKG